MKLQLEKLRDSLADSFWFLPAMMASLSAVIAFGMVSIDHAVGAKWVQDIAWIWSGGPDGARSVLSTVAGSVMTVISIVFSLTISALAQTSSHFGPRVLRNFTSDRFVQFTLGTFIATFVYCLLVLRTVRSIEEAAFVPYIAVNLGVALSIASLGVLIFFIHHISQSIQAENLIADVGLDFQRAVEVLFPERIGNNIDEIEKGETEVLAEDHWDYALTVEARGSGYLQRVDEQQLLRLASQHDLQIKMEKRPGQFVSRHVSLLRVVPASHADTHIRLALSNCFIIGAYRTPHQDVLFSMQQLVEIASHALSPGINEPFTALTCIDWLGASLRSVVERSLPSPLRYDDQEHLRIVACPVSFDEVADTAFEQIRIYGASSPDVLINLLRTISEVASSTHLAQDRKILAHHAHLIGEDAQQISNSSDRERVKEQLQMALRNLNAAA